MRTIAQARQEILLLKLRPLYDARKEIAELKRKGEAMEASMPVTGDGSTPGFLDDVYDLPSTRVGKARIARRIIEQRKRQAAARPATSQVGLYLHRAM
jgi:hypothetical protein